MACMCRVGSPERPVVVERQLEEMVAQEDHLLGAREHAEVRGETELERVLLDEVVAEGVERRDLHVGVAVGHERVDALFHLRRGLVGERQREDLGGPRAPARDQVGDAPGDDGGLARPRAGDDQQRPAGVGDRGGLGVVEPFEDPVDAPRALVAQRRISVLSETRSSSSSARPTRAMSPQIVHLSAASAVRGVHRLLDRAPGELRPEEPRGERIPGTDPVDHRHRVEPRRPPRAALREHGRALLAHGEGDGGPRRERASPSSDASQAAGELEDGGRVVAADEEVAHRGQDLDEEIPRVLRRPQARAVVDVERDRHARGGGLADGAADDVAQVLAEGGRDAGDVQESRVAARTTSRTRPAQAG